MIFTTCRTCDTQMVVPYEAGEPGAGMFDRVVCEKCGSANFVQLCSFGGVTLSADEAKERGLVKRDTR